MAHQLPCVLLTRPMVDTMVPSLEKSFSVLKLWEARDERALIAAHSPSIRAVVCNTVVGASTELINALPNLEIVATFSVGLDKIDLPLCRKRGIAVAYTPDVLTDCTADTALALMLACMRRIPAADRFVREGRWLEQTFVHTTKVSGKRVGIVGLGRIGMAIAKRTEAFGCTISYQSRSSKENIPYKYYSDVRVMAANTDVLIIACPLTEETKGVVNREVLDALGPSGFLINIARGPIVDENELVKALAEGRLGGAGLDVYDNEPYVPEELFHLDNVVLAPHVGSLTWETRRNMAALVVANVEAHFSGKPLVTPAPLS